MSSTINAATSGGLISTGDTSGQLQLQTAGTTSLTINSSQQVGIGDTAPSYKLSVQTAASGNIARFSDGTAQTLIVGTSSTGLYYNNANSGYQAWQIGGTEAGRFDSSGNLLVGTTSATGAITAASALTTTKQFAMRDNTSNYVRKMGVDSSNNWIFYDGNTEQMRLDSSGNLNIKTSNAGIVFNNSSALTNSTLNDYEVGTWTPTDGSGAGLTFSNYTGCAYIKIGKILMLYGTLTYPTTTNTTAAQINIPFTVTGLGGGFTQYTNGGTYGSLTFRNSGGTAGGNTMLVTNGVSNGTAVQNVQLSGATFQFVFTGPVAF